MTSGPTRRALVIESSYNALDGFANSAACMVQLLDKRCFQITQCRGSDATRDGILAAYKQLIANTGPGDAVVVYYVGHGGLTTNAFTTPKAKLPRYIQNICPSDYADTTENDFRGVSTWELSLLLAALTKQTTNVTTILECCYAAQLVRSFDPSAPMRVPPTLSRDGLAKHLRTLRADSNGFSELDLAGNPHAVRVAACGQTASSFQVPLPPRDARRVALDLAPGQLIGGLTLWLAEVIARIDTAQVSWRSIASELRARLYAQQPEIDGPIRRVPFSLTTIDTDAVPARVQDGKVRLEAGALFGVSVGDVYAILSPGGTADAPAARLAELTIDQVSAATSEGSAIQWTAGVDALPIGAVAIATSSAFPRFPVQVHAEAGDRQVIEARLAHSRLVRSASGDDVPIAILRVQDGALALDDAHGALFESLRCPDDLAVAISTLEDLATEARLRSLRDETGTALDVSTELLIVGPQGSHVVPPHDSALGLADRVALRLTNRSAAPVYAQVFRVGVRRRITRLSGGTLGLALPPPAAGAAQGPPLSEIYVGDRIDGKLKGFAPEWPDGLPRDQARRDSLLVVLTEQPADLSALIRDDPRDRRRGGQRRVLSALETLLDQLATGTTRASAPPGFALRWLDYWLHPVDASIDDVARPPA